jgi:hypothetical protein
VTALGRWGIPLGGLPQPCDAVPPSLGLFLDALVRLFVFALRFFKFSSYWLMS